MDSGWGVPFLELLGGVRATGIKQAPSCALGEDVGHSHLGEEVDAVSDGAHGHRVAPDEEASEVHPVQAVELGIEASELPDVIADHVQ
jgi:hypothetical protein